MRAAVLGIVADRGKMQNPVTGSGGMLTGVVDAAGPDSPLGLKPGDQIATLVSLSLTPLVITDGLASWDGRSEQVPCAGHAILFGRSIAAVLPADLPAELALAVMDVCGAPALTHRVVAGHAAGGSRAAPAPWSPSSARPARAAPCRPPPRAGPAPARSSAWSPSRPRRTCWMAAGLADEIVIADARDPVGVSRAIEKAGGPADVTVVCVDVPGCEGGAILATAPGGTVIFFSMATSFTAAALGAEGAAADVTMLVGNGYVPGHAQLALDLIRAEPGVRALFDRRIDESGSPEAGEAGSPEAKE